MANPPIGLVNKLRAQRQVPVPPDLVGQLQSSGIALPVNPAPPLPPPVPPPTVAQNPFGLPAMNPTQGPIKLRDLGKAEEQLVRVGQEREFAERGADGAPVVDLRTDKQRGKPMPMREVDFGQGPPIDGASPADLVAAPAPPAATRAVFGASAAPQEQWRVGPSVRAAFGKADEEQRRAINENKALGLEQADREEDAYRRFEEDQAVQNAKAEQAEKNRKAVEQSYQEQYNSYADEVANTKIDPGRKWSDANAFQKAGYLLNKLARGFLIGSGRGDIGDALEAETQKDIDAQKANLANKRATLASKQTAFAMAKERFGDERVAEAAAKAGMLEQMKSRLGQLAAQSQSTQVKQRANEMMANLENRIAVQLNAMKAFGVAGAGKANEANVKWLSEQEQKLDIGGTEAMANNLLSMIPAKGDIPGVGRFADRLYKGAGNSMLAGMAYDTLYGQQGAAIQQQVAGLENQFRHQLTGSSASPSEMANYEAERGAVHDADSLRRWISNTMNVIHAKQATARAGVKPQDVVSYEQRKALFAPRQAAPSAPRGTFQQAGGGKK